MIPGKQFDFLSQEVFYLGHVYFLGWTPLRDHPPPKPPSQCPHQTKKGTNLLLFKFCIHLQTHQDLKLECCRVMGQKLRYGRPYTHDLPGTHNWLAQPHIASISPKDYIMLAQPWKFGVHCCSSGLTCPAACTRARVPLTVGHVHRPSLNPIYSKMVAID